MSTLTKHVLGFSVLLLVSCSHRLPDLTFKPAPVSSQEFRHSMEKIVGTKIHQGNSVQKYVNGEEFFPAMLSDMKKATSSIYFEMYIFREGEVMTGYSEVLAQKAKQGLDVRLLGDHMGCNRMSKTDISKMESAGVKIEFVNPMHRNVFSANNRDHKKYLIIDGKVGYTGGAGMADKWLGDGDSDDEWRDNMYRVEGAAVTDMQSAFIKGWNNFSKDTLTEQESLSSNRAFGNVLVQDVSEDPKDDRTGIAHSYIHSIRSAQNSIYIQMAYTCPPKIIANALLEAKARGVEIQVIIPSANTDSNIARRCGHNFWKRLIKSGIDVWEYTPSNMHVKAVVIDEEFTIVGAANLDYRSFYINYENNLHVYDKPFAKKHIEQFNKDLKSCVKLDLEGLEFFSLWSYIWKSQI